MIKVIMELELVFPYKLSMEILVEFCFLWDSHLVYGGTKKIKAIISMPANHFKKIFSTNPKAQEYSVPKGMEHFINRITVKKVITKGD